MRNWPAVEIASKLVKEPPGYARGALIEPICTADAFLRERRQKVLAELRTKLFEYQQKGVKRHD